MWIFLLNVRGYLPLIWKGSITHMHGLAVYVKEGLAFAQDLSLENSADSHLCFWLALRHPFPPSITSIVMDGFWFYFIWHRWDSLDQLICKRVFLCTVYCLWYNFSISNDLTQMVNFPTWISDCNSHSPALLYLFLSSDRSICPTMAFSLLENSNHVVVSVFIA